MQKTCAVKRTNERNGERARTRTPGQRNHVGSRINYVASMTPVCRHYMLNTKTLYRCRSDVPHAHAPQSGMGRWCGGRNNEAECRVELFIWKYGERRTDRETQATSITRT